MFNDVTQWVNIRNRVLIHKCSKRKVIRETGLSWKTLQKILTHPFPPPHKRKKVGKSASTVRNSRAATKESIKNILDFIAQADPAGVKEILCGVASIIPQTATSADLANLRDTLRARGFGTRPSTSEFVWDRQPHDWMSRVILGDCSVSEIRDAVGDVPDLDELVTSAKNGTLKERKRAMAILARLHNISLRVVGRFLHTSSTSLLRHWKAYSQGGVKSLFLTYNSARVPKAQDEAVQKAVFAVFHAPPQAFNVNRTTWKMDDLIRCLALNGTPVSKPVIQQVFKLSGFKWRKAKVVLTSRDPKYREKLDHIHGILSHLRDDDRFFSIDEFGPFAVKAKGGKRFVAPDDYPSVPQRQRSKGCLIITAALELSRNQVTHFYSAKKNTEEMVKLLRLLLEQCKGCRTLYFSWDAASWHASKLLYKTVEEVNSVQYRKDNGTPFVALAPLPASAQFLNVIESVFSGMAKAIIHNSDYESLEMAMVAINHYFADRNAFFNQHPKRAGKKIWGKEITPAVFDETQNCKDPLWSCPR